MNHINYIIKGNCIKIFPESRWISESSIILDGMKNALGDVRHTEGL